MVARTMRTQEAVIADMRRARSLGVTKGGDKSGTERSEARLLCNVAMSLAMILLRSVCQSVTR